MSRDEARWADGLLAGARAFAEPRPEDATRNFAAIEARLGNILDASSDADCRPSGESSIVTRLPRAPAPPVARSATLAAARGLPALAKAGLVLTFGLGTGLVGYWMGRAETAVARDAAARETPSARADVGLGSSLQRDLSSPVGLEAQREGRGSAAEAFVSSDPSARVPPESVAVAPSPRRADVRRTPERARVAAARQARGVRTLTAAEPAFGLRDAIELLRRAEAALRRADGLEASMWLGDLDRRAPPGLLLEERLVSKTLAHCALGDVAQAQQTLSQLVAQNAESMYRARLEGSCVADRLRQP
jgi:hypothetical protein